MAEIQEAPAPFTAEEMGAAQNAEQFALMEAQMEHLKQRCVLLHANLIRAQGEAADLREALNAKPKTVSKSSSK